MLACHQDRPPIDQPRSDPVSQIHGDIGSERITRFVDDGGNAGSLEDFTNADDACNFSYTGQAHKTAVVAGGPESHGG